MVSVRVDKLKKRLSDLRDERLKQEVLHSLIEEAKIKLAELEDYKAQLIKGSDMLNKAKHEANRYLTLKQTTMIESINESIKALSALIKSPTELELKLSENKVEIVTQRGTKLIRAEGGGYRSILATQIRVLAVWNSNYSNFMILDEPIAQAERNNTIYFADFLREMGKQMQIIFVCQDAEEYLKDKVDKLVAFKFDNETKSSYIQEFTGELENVEAYDDI